MAHPLDGVRIGKSERELAKAHMESAERFASLVCGVVSGVQSLAVESARGLVVVAHYVKAAFGKPAPR
ncbi:MAG: hypothetical protein ACK4N4_15300 [Burkholderiales bacterium]